jgi:hypothetical protein
MKAKILDKEKNPHALESLYRSNPQEFKNALLEIYTENPDSEIFKVWYERLFFEDTIVNKIETKKRKSSYDFFIVLLFCILAGLLVKLPDFFKFIKYDIFCIRNLSFFFLPFITIYYLIQKKANWRHWLIILLPIILSAVYINLLPGTTISNKMPDTFILACIHLPFFIWFISGFGFMLPELKNIEKRIEFLKLNGEIFVYTALMIAGLIVLTGSIYLLFSAGGFDTINVLTKWVLPIGIVSSPIVAMSLVYNNEKIVKLAPLLSRIFAPLFSITLLVFLGFIFSHIRNPFPNRDFLLFVNLFLLLVVVISTLVLIHKVPNQKINFFDYNNFILLIASFIVEIFASVNVLLRLTTFGFTPNRVALIGLNIIILIHLIGMIVNYIKWFTKKANIFMCLKFVANYISVYFYWSIFIVFVFPWIFSLR